MSGTVYQVPVCDYVKQADGSLKCKHLANVLVVVEDGIQKYVCVNGRPQFVLKGQENEYPVLMVPGSGMPSQHPDWVRKAAKKVKK